MTQRASEALAATSRWAHRLQVGGEIADSETLADGTTLVKDVEVLDVTLIHDHDGPCVGDTAIIPDHDITADERAAVADAGAKAAEAVRTVAAESAAAVAQKDGDAECAAPVVRVGRHAAGTKPASDATENRKTRRKMSKATRRRNRR